MKRIFCAVLALIIMAGFLPAGVRAYSNEQYPVEGGNITLSLDYDETFYEVYDCDDSVTSVTIPAKFNGKPVTKIGDILDPAFSDCKKLVSVKMPDSITEIGYDAFRNCTSLTGIEIPNSVTSIGSRAFKGCSKLEEIVIPSSVTKIGDELFKDCTSLKKAVLSEGLTVLGEGMFHSCSSLTEIVIPKGVTELPSFIFWNCKNLKKVYIPASVKKISTASFENTGLTDVYYAGTEAQWNAIKEYYNSSSFSNAKMHFGVSYDDISKPAAMPAELSNLKKVRTYPDGLFKDVPSDFWCYANVKQAYELNLLNGTTETTFSPNGNVTVAQMLAFAARLHSVYTSGKVEFVQGEPWYQVYLDYCVKNGIVKENRFENHTVAATRAQAALILASALPDEALPVKNLISDNEIPDVTVGTDWGNAVYKLYRAGILTGGNEYGDFYPTRNIRRSEVSALLTRMADVSLRKEVSLLTKETIAFNSAEVPMNIEQRIAVTPTFTPSNAQNKQVTWSSSNPSVAKVDASGTVTAVAKGSTTITATSKSGSTAMYTVNVVDYTYLVSNLFSSIKKTYPVASALSGSVYAYRDPTNGFLGLVVNVQYSIGDKKFSDTILYYGSQTIKNPESYFTQKQNQEGLAGKVMWIDRYNAYLAATSQLILGRGKMLTGDYLNKQAALRT